MRILITGGAGFIGSHLVDRFYRDNHDICVYDDLSGGKIDNIFDYEKISFFSGQKEDIPSEWIEGSVIFHLASTADISKSMKYPFITFSENLQLTQFLLQRSVSLGAERFIFVSSSGVYDNSAGNHVYSEDSDLDPSTPYSASKLAGECLVRMTGYSGDLPCLSIRPFNVYGPRQRVGGTDRPVIPSFLTALCKGEPVTIEGGGEQSLDFIFVEDAARWLAGLIEVDTDVLRGQPINLGSGTTTSILDVLGLCEGIVECKTKIIHKKARSWYFRSTIADTKSMASFGRVPERSIKDGLQRTLPYYRG